VTVSTTRREARLVKNEIRGLVIPGSDQIGRSARTIQIGGDFAELFGPKSQSAESESQIIGNGSNDIFHFRNYGNRKRCAKILLSPSYGHSVCEAKINPAPKSIAMKLVTKVSPLAAKDTIMAPRVSAPALMCFGSIINLALLQ
jgi:hypothetical protein